MRWGSPVSEGSGTVSRWGLCIVILGAGVSWTATVWSATAEDYTRAERFLAWNRDRYIVNADIQHHWIAGEDRFWYRRTNAAGESQFVVVDAASGRQNPAFDQQKIATALSDLTGKKIEAGQLPFSSFLYGQNKTTIQFQLGEAIGTCRLRTSVCVYAAPVGSANESVSPDRRWAAFLRNYNLWIRPLSGGAEFPLTTDGLENYSYASLPGYSTHAVSDLRHPKPTPPEVIWSPDSRYILTHRIDERAVKDLFLIQSAPEDGGVRPKLYSYRFALLGDEQLPQLAPVVLDVGARRQVSVAIPPLNCLPMTLIDKHDTWWSPDSNSIYFLNRDRFSRSIGLERVNPATGGVREVLREASETIVEVNASSVFDVPTISTLENGDVIWYSQRDGWGHLYYYDGATGNLRNQIIRGDWVVRSIVRIDQKNRQIYFMASGREVGRDPYEQHLYSVRFDGSGIRLLTPEDAEHERPHLLFESSQVDMPSFEGERDRFSRSGNYFVDSYSRPDEPPVLVLRAADGRLIKQLEQADISKLRSGGYMPIEPFEVLAADGKTKIYGNLFRPSTFTPTRQYPVIDSILPGPHTIRTRKSFTEATFDTSEAQSLAELGFIVITIDGRGTPYRSKAFFDHSYGRLDQASDLQDHIAAIRELAQRYPYLDLDRVGADGVSAGGYAAAHAVLAYPDFYKVAVAAEGVHDPRAYLAPWGDTYIGPADLSGPSSSSNLALAGNLKGKLLLMHGEMDDNVSPALTMKLVDALIKVNKDFDLLLIPNENHFAYLMSRYFIRRKWDYFVRNLLGTEPPSNYAITGPQ